MLPNLDQLPNNLPIPIDDGLATHLVGLKLPNIALESTYKTLVNISDIQGWLVLYCYPMTGQPGKDLPKGWDIIPGARGCTPQNCAFRDHYSELRQLTAQVFGMSTQSSESQEEMALRLHLPFPILSDWEMKVTDALKLPTFKTDESTLLKRLTIISLNGEIKHVNYPVFPPNEDAENVISWLKTTRKVNNG